MSSRTEWHLYPSANKFRFVRRQASIVSVYSDIDPNNLQSRLHLEMVQERYANTELSCGPKKQPSCKLNKAAITLR